MAFLSLTMSAVWLMVIADEVVALLQALGRILNFPMVSSFVIICFRFHTSVKWL